MIIQLPTSTGKVLTIDLSAFVKMLDEVFTGKILIEEISKICNQIYRTLRRKFGHEHAIASFDLIISLLKCTNLN